MDFAKALIAYLALASGVLAGGGSGALAGANSGGASKTQAVIDASPMKGLATGTRFVCGLPDWSIGGCISQQQLAFCVRGTWALTTCTPQYCAPSVVPVGTNILTLSKDAYCSALFEQYGFIQIAYE